MKKLQINELEESLRFKFDGTNKMDIDTAIEYLNYIRQTVNQSTLTSGESFVLNVDLLPIKKGSFLIDLLLSAPAVNQVLTEITPEGVKSIYDNIVESIKIIPFLGGKKPKSESKDTNTGKINIVSIGGKKHTFSPTIVNNYYNGTLPAEYLIEAFSKADATEMTVYGSNGKPFLKVKRDAAKKITREYNKLKDYTKKEKKDKISITESVLAFKNVDLYGDTNKWRFRYRGNDITVTIKDDSFMSLVREGKIHYSQGLSVKGTLTQVSKVNKETGKYEDPTYSLDKIEVIKSAKQTSIDFKENQKKTTKKTSKK